MLHLHPIKNRGVAQLASVLAWGARGRQFESDHSDFKCMIIRYLTVFCTIFCTKNNIKGIGLYFPAPFFIFIFSLK